jgi:excinuclease ABC subunit C
MGVLEEKIPTLPDAPGVYLMKGSEGTVIYVGKAKDLRARIRAYIGSAAISSPKSRFLVPKVQELEYIVTGTEKEALLLENTLIKKYRPRYNVTLKDDKTYLSLVIDLNHPFPRIALVRRPEHKVGVLIFGPYASASAARETLRQIHKLYPLRTCKDSDFRNRTRPCLNCQMHRCPGPCVGGISQEAYREMVDQAIMVLQGRSEDLITLLEKKMSEASEAMRFEEAALLRDRIRAVRLTVEQQRVVTTSRIDRDVYGLYQEGSTIELSILLIRRGNLVECKGFSFSQVPLESSEVLASFLIQYYSIQGESGPEEVLLPIEPEGFTLLKEMLRERMKGSFRLMVPHRAEKYQLVLMANLNAKTRYQDKIVEDRLHWIAMEEIKERFRMDRLPRRIECFDISAMQGTMAVGSQVSFTDGVPDKEGYRRYRIQVPVGADDYGMMYEVLFRRYERAKHEGDLPDLLLVDGGKGHLNVALRVLKDLGIKGIKVAGIAKLRETERGSKGRADQERVGDRIFLPGQVHPVRFSTHSQGHRLVQQVRNEAHRFAITYHRRLRSKAIQGSELDTIPGVGGARKRSLLAHFGDIELIRKATVDQLSTVPNIPRYVAERIWDHLHPYDNPHTEPAGTR